MSKFINLFQKKTDPKELVRKWQSTIRSEMRALDRQAREIKREEKKVTKSIKECAKRSDLNSAKLLAKELVQSRRTVTRLHTNKAQLNSVSMKLGESLAMVKVVGTLEKSGEVMTAINNLVKVPEIARQMQEMSKEMMKAGMIEEMVTDALEDMEEENLEEETEAEVDKVLQEIAGETIAALPGTAAAATKQAAAAAQKAAEAAKAEEQDVEFAALQERLNAVRM
mmetsp:Transcript_39708/g.55131  ORF Transcript_39708/g.55131 Transcript_39708/m.55131 type:complete len:225 (-) Transcript_39708:169-843(-)|eukprot:CAMPEP_0196593878 /NCGR_PEP_ID=MMETSP1081-20130531/76845_1 /TAXON_ID=36882 /ORGANISM="Pyramimonas amylifera, Strain CCMP720" /LENGTH=224 /DNA_ID=CAMNT_0041917993 /DNA_START=227 /DNA_END=901 /DNA_ORIENTATION=+